MRVVVVTPPDPALPLDLVKRHLRVEGDADNTLIASYIEAATEHLDGPAGWLGRALGVQTLEAHLDNFDCGSIRLPYPPVIEIVSITYVDAAGVDQTIAADRYELLGPSLVPVYGASWPRPRWQREAVRVRYHAGYAQLPAAIRAALLLVIGDLWNNRETAGWGVVTEIPMPASVTALLTPFRVWG